MADPIVEEGASRCADENPSETKALAGVSRKERRKAAKKLKRKQIRKEVALRQLAEEEARMNDPAEQLRIQLKEQEEAERSERDRKEFEERERMWLEAAAARKSEEEAQQKILLESQMKQLEQEKGLEEEDEWEYADEGPAEIIWKGNEIIVKKKKVRVSKKCADQRLEEDAERPTSNPLPPQSAAFASYKNNSLVSAHQMFETVSQQTPNFGTEQDKAHCPFHIKTGACRFGSRCSRVHFYPDKSCTLLIKNMYNGPGLAWEQDEGLEYMDEEVERCYEEFYEDVHTEFLKFGEIINFKVCRNGSFHLRGNVYVHYKSLESAMLAYRSMNGRYFAGKQITCEFVAVTRWKVAICGEYMKSRLKTCSHGTACNFIHCFRNPGGDYEWADWDNPPPKYWVKKMAALFGPSDELESNDRVFEDQEVRSSSRKSKADSGRYHNRKSRPGEDWQDTGSDRDRPGRKRERSKSHSSRRQSIKTRATSTVHERTHSNERYGRYKHDSDEDYYHDESRVRCSSRSRTRSSSRKKEQRSPDECNQSNDMYSSDDHPKVGEHRASDRDSTRNNGGSGNQSRLRARTSSWKEEVDFSVETEKKPEDNNICNRYQKKSGLKVDDSEGDYPDSHRVERGSHSSSRSHSISQRKHMDFHHEHKKFEQKYDSVDHERYYGNQGSCAYSSNIDHENEHQDDKQSRKRKRNNSSKVKMCYQSCRKLKKMYDSDDYGRSDGRSRSVDCDSIEGHEESRSHSHKQSKRERTISLGMETSSPDEKR